MAVMTTLRRHAGVNATGTGPKLRTLINRVDNPRAVNSTGIVFSGGTGGSATRANVLTGGPLPILPSFSRVTYSVAQTGGTASHYNGADGKNLVEPGKTFVLKAWVRVSVAMNITLKAGFYNGATYLSGSNAAATAVAANTWTQLTHEFTVPASTTRVQINTDQSGAGGPYFPIGGTFDATGWFVFEKPAGATDSTAYGDGDVAGWTWAGTAHASQSSGFGAIA
jgi:hypothetical protein